MLFNLCCKMRFNLKKIPQFLSDINDRVTVFLRNYSILFLSINELQTFLLKTWALVQKM